jgi:hypothetical protein
MCRVFPLVLVMGGLTLAAGCGKGSGLVPVEGRVTLDGKPVKEVIVNFQPINDTPGNGALGSTDPDGRFTLTDARGEAGVYAGEYKVIFYPALPAGVKEGDPADVVGVARGRNVPAIYLDVNHTPLRATVPQGGGTFEVILTKSGKGAAAKIAPNTEGR